MSSFGSTYSNGLGQEQAPSDTGVNSPELSPVTLKPKQRAITDVDHLFRLIGTLQEARRLQNNKNGKIQEKLNSERPYNETDLKEEGLGYKSNFSTKPMSTTVGKVGSRLTKAIQEAKYLTSAALPDSITDAKMKTELFRLELTNLIRKWPDWYMFVNDVAAEDATFGWTTVTWFDKSTWKPVHFRQDRAFLPDATKQSSGSLQFGCFIEYIPPHELVEVIRDKEAAEAAGWNIDNTVRSINNARPPSIPSPQAAPYTDARRYQDAIRESSATLSLLNGAKEVMLWHTVVTEIDGKISYYIADGYSKELLYEGLDRFDSMPETVGLMSFEQGNGSLMGSKGIGREIYEIANALDRARNEAIDRLQMSGKIIVQGDEQNIDRFKLSVVGNVALIPSGFKIEQNRIESSAKEFLELDQFLTGLLDQIAGGVSPQRNEGRERVTKAEVDLNAEREEEKRDDVTTRFVQLFGNNVISNIQRRVCSDECTDEDAKQFREKMLQYMPREELDMLARQPALQTIEDYTQSDSERLVLFAQEHREDPLYNQYELQRRAAAVAFNSEFADAVLLPQNDPTEVAENTRTQLQESFFLSQGRPQPVSPRDNHEIHIGVLKPDFAPIAAQAGKLDPQAIQIGLGFIKHWEDHMNYLVNGGYDKAKLAPEVAELKKVAALFGELMAKAQHAAQLHAAGVSPVSAHASAMGLTPDNEPGEPAPQAGQPAVAPAAQ